MRSETSSSSSGWGPSARAEPELDPRVAPPQVVARGGQVAEQVDARREEVGDHQDPGRPPGHAPVAPGRDVGLGQFEEARLDDRVIAPRRRAAPRAGAGRRSPAAWRLPWAISRTAV